MLRPESEGNAPLPHPPNTNQADTAPPPHSHTSTEHTAVRGHSLRGLV